MSVVLAMNAGVLTVTGSIDFANANQCLAEGQALLLKANGPVTLDLSGLDKASSISVAVLLNWARSQSARGYLMSLRAVPEKCRAILRVSGLLEAMPEVDV